MGTFVTFVGLVLFMCVWVMWAGILADEAYATDIKIGAFIVTLPAVIAATLCIIGTVP